MICSLARSRAKCIRVHQDCTVQINDTVVPQTGSSRTIIDPSYGMHADDRQYIQYVMNMQQACLYIASSCLFVHLFLLFIQPSTPFHLRRTRARAVGFLLHIQPSTSIVSSIHGEFSHRSNISVPFCLMYKIVEETLLRDTVRTCVIY